MYKVIKLFTDLQDNGHKYEVGDEYPRLGLKPSLARIAELSGSENRQKTPLIVEVDDLAEKQEAENKPKRKPSKKKTSAAAEEKED